MLASLFYTSSIVLAESDKKTYQQLKTYTEDNLYLTQLDNAPTDSGESSKTNQPSDEDKIIQTINEIIRSRFQSFNQLHYFKSLYPKSSGQEVQRLFFEKNWLSENEILLGSSLCKWKYSSNENEVLVINPTQIETLKRDNILMIQNDVNDEMKNYSIYNLFSERNNDKIPTTRKLDCIDNYVEWKHKSRVLMKLLNNNVKSSMVVVSCLVDKHWVLLVGVDFCGIGATSAAETESIRIYYFDGYYNNNTPFLEINVNDVTNYLKYSGIIRLIQLILLFQRYKTFNPKKILLDETKTTIKIKKEFYDKIESTGDLIINVKVAPQYDQYTCGLHVIRFMNEILRIRQKLYPTSFTQSKFESELASSKQLNLYNWENNILKMELMEYYLHAEYTSNLLTNSLDIPLIMKNDESSESYGINEALSDVLAENDKLRRKLKIKIKPNTKIDRRGMVPNLSNHHVAKTI